MQLENILIDRQVLEASRHKWQRMNRLKSLISSIGLTGAMPKDIEGTFVFVWTIDLAGSKSEGAVQGIGSAGWYDYSVADLQKGKLVTILFCGCNSQDGFS